MSEQATSRAPRASGGEPPHRVPMDISDAIAALPLLVDGDHPGRHPLTASHNEPAPRDSDLIQQVRALVKRYGAPVIAAEAARQAQHH